MDALPSLRQAEVQKGVLRGRRSVRVRNYCALGSRAIYRSLLQRLENFLLLFILQGYLFLLILHFLDYGFVCNNWSSCTFGYSFWKTADARPDASRPPFSLRYRKFEAIQVYIRLSAGRRPTLQQFLGWHCSLGPRAATVHPPIRSEDHPLAVPRAGNARSPGRRRRQSACLRRNAGISISSMPLLDNASTFAAALCERAVRHTLGVLMLL